MKITPIKLHSVEKTNFKSAKKQDIKNLIGDNKKAVIGGIAALAIAGVGACIAIKKSKVPSEVKEVLKNFKIANKNVMETIEKQDGGIQKIFDKTTELFMKGDEITPEGKVVRQITQGKNSEKIMQEFREDGSLFRESTFVNDILEEIEEGAKHFEDGTETIAKKISFDEGKPWAYWKNYKEFGENSFKMDENIIFENGKISYYAKDYKINDDDATIASELIKYEDGKVRCYQEGYKKLEDGTVTIANRLNFKDNKPHSLEINYDSKKGKAERVFGFINNVWREITK